MPTGIVFITIDKVNIQPTIVIAVNKLGINTLKNEPEDVKVALLCVRHAQFDDFFKNFDGILYDYKNVVRIL